MMNGVFDGKHLQVAPNTFVECRVRLRRQIRSCQMGFLSGIHYHFDFLPHPVSEAMACSLDCACSTWSLSRRCYCCGLQYQQKVFDSIPGVIPALYYLRTDHRSRSWK